MGETGCGKTRLIRFMCDLAAQSSGQKNMFILKVCTCTSIMGFQYRLKIPVKISSLLHCVGLVLSYIVLDSSNYSMFCKHRFMEAPLRLMLLSLFRVLRDMLWKIGSINWTLLCSLMKPTQLMP